MFVLMFFAGLVCLVLGAELLVCGAARLAAGFGVSPLVVGLTIVAMGTSSPELAVSIGAALDGESGIAVGNVVGSNIFNVLFILGVSALIIPLAVSTQVVRQEVPIMIGASLLLIVFAFDRLIGAFEGVVLLALLAAYTVFLVVQSRAAGAQGEVDAMPAATGMRGVLWQLGLIVAGLALLVVGADWLVAAATAFARAFGVSDLVIGLTIVAAGTSMPELATSIVAALRGQRDIAIGNVVGSNTFNILGCLGVTALVAPGGLPIADAVMHFDAWVMLAVAVACVPVFLTGRSIARWEGALFVLYYVAYAGYLALMAQHHALLGPYSLVMLGFVVPLTVVTLVVSFLRERRSVR
ncbi:MAG: calcium/sodium antiporter [Pseudazoarcus pumilus]|nr:calcium/sodium antiporter [Pseudazoarcus pumilus]